jgi:hypothetical protein
MTDPIIPDPLDGFRVEIDTRRERADVILDRPPLNVIAMPQREQLRAAFEALDADEQSGNRSRIAFSVASVCAYALLRLSPSSARATL